MSSLDRHVIEWMRTHRSTVSSVFLDDAGVTDARRRRLVRDGILERVVNGGYRFAGTDADELTRCAALCTSRPHLIVAGPTAGRIWGVRRSPRDGLVHVIAPPASQPCRVPWVRAYRTALIHADEIVERPDGIRLTSPPRTLVDLARYLPSDALASAIEWALHGEVCTAETLRRLAERLNTPGRPWVRKFLRVLAGRAPGRARESDWERRVFDALVRRGVDGLESQVTERIAGLGTVRFDIAIPSIRWVLEVDVHPEHRTVEGQGGDHRRDRRGRRVGWAIERVAEAELTSSLEATLDDLVGSINQRRLEIDALSTAGLWPPPR
jgi:very-short-patch-repair endonuclease